MSRRVVVTGVGLVSSLGESLDVHLAALDEDFAPVVDTESHAPYPIHPLAPIDYSLQIPKRGDLRQMEGWQRLGVYTAGVALQSAGLSDDEEAKDRLELLVAAGGGERDIVADSEIVTGLLHTNNRSAFLNEHLLSELRPTLFLAQLSNLLAGNIAIVHGVTGGSCTFMGEEQAGVDVIRIATSKIAAGQSEAVMIGASYNAARPDMLLGLEFNTSLHKGQFAPVFSADRRGAIMGSIGAFLVLESMESAIARNARIFAEISGAASGRTSRAPDALKHELSSLIRGLGPFGDDVAVVSAASGVAPRTADERAAIDAVLPGASVIGVSDLMGHGLEAAFPAAVAIGAARISAESASDIVVTCASRWRGYGAVRLVEPSADVGDGT